MSQHECGTINDNGERLIDFSGLNNFVIGGTLFAHKKIHKLTWISPNQRDKNHVDHLLISCKWRRSLQDVRVRRGADIGSDHHLVVAHIKLKLKRTGTAIRLLKRFDVSKLKDAGARQQFFLQVRNRFAALEYVDEEINTEEGSATNKWSRTGRMSYTPTLRPVVQY